MEEDFGQLMAYEAEEHPEVTVVPRVLAGTPRAALLAAGAAPRCSWSALAAAAASKA